MTEELLVHVLFVAIDLLRLAGFILASDLMMEGIGQAMGWRIPAPIDRYKLYVGLWIFYGLSIL